MLKRHAPATDRNREVILAVLRDLVPPQGLVLEISSGTGQHAAFFASAFPSLTWQPSDPDALSRESIAAWCEGIANVRAPLELDVMQPWPIGRADVVVNINMIHIAPFEACEALMKGAAEVLPAGGVLFMYGPYLRAEVPTAPSNVAFDQSLRERDPRWGIRDLGAVTEIAGRHGLVREAVHEMPANNLSVVYRRAPE